MYVYTYTREETPKYIYAYAVYKMHNLAIHTCYSSRIRDKGFSMMSREVGGHENPMTHKCLENTPNVVEKNPGFHDDEV